MHYFTDEETKLIRELYPKYGNKTWSMMPRRELFTKGALRQRARRMGLNSLNQEVEWTLARDDAIYLAAIIDGEGSIMLEQQSGGRPYYIPKVSVYNTNYLLIDWIKKTVIPIPSCRTMSGRKSHWKIGYQLDVRGVGSAYSLLKKIKPFLKLKTEQADLVLEYCESRIGKRRKDGSRSTREIEIYKRIRELNKRGREAINNV